MNIESLKEELKRLQVPENWYSINGSLQSDRHFLMQNYHRWEYFYFDERGNRDNYKVFMDEGEACEYFLCTIKSELAYLRKDVRWC